MIHVFQGLFKLDVCGSAQSLCLGLLAAKVASLILDNKRPLIPQIIRVIMWTYYVAMVTVSYTFVNLFLLEGLKLL